MPEGTATSRIRSLADHAARIAAGRGRLVLFAGAILSVLVLPIDFAGSDWIPVKSAFAGHDHSHENGKGHNGGGNSGGASNPGSDEDSGDGGGGRDGADDDKGGRRGGGTASSSEGGSGGVAEAGEAEDEMARDALDAVETVEGPPTDAAGTDLPTIREIFALPEDAVVGPEEERALIANGWSYADLP